MEHQSILKLFLSFLGMIDHPLEVLQVTCKSNDFDGENG